MKQRGSEEVFKKLSKIGKLLKEVTNQLKGKWRPHRSILAGVFVSLIFGASG